MGKLTCGPGRKRDPLFKKGGTGKRGLLAHRQPLRHGGKKHPEKPGQANAKVAKGMT